MALWDRLTDGEERELHRLVASGVTNSSELGRLIGRSTQAVCDWGHRSNTPLDAPKPPCVVCASEHRQAIKAWVLEGVEYKVIAQRVGLSVSPVANHGKRHMGVDREKACMVCSHSSADELDLALLSGADAPSVAAQFGVSAAMVRLHRANHLQAPPPRPACPVCSHSQMAEVEQAYNDRCRRGPGRGRGDTRGVASEYGIPPVSLRHHMANHTSAEWAMRSATQSVERLNAVRSYVEQRPTVMP